MSPDVNVFLECKQVVVTENLRQDWVDSVGEESLFLLEALGREGFVQRWGVPDFEQFVADQGSAHR